MPTMTATIAKATQDRPNRNHTADELAALDAQIRRTPNVTASEIAEAVAACVRVPFGVCSVRKRRRVLGLSGSPCDRRRSPQGLALDALISKNRNLGPADLMALAVAKGLVACYTTIASRRLALGCVPMVPNSHLREVDPDAAEQVAIDKRIVILRRAALIDTLDPRAPRACGNLVARMLVNWRAGGLGEPAPAASRYVGPDPTKSRLSAEVESMIGDWRDARARRRAEAAAAVAAAEAAAKVAAKATAKVAAECPA